LADHQRQQGAMLRRQDQRRATGRTFGHELALLATLSSIALDGGEPDVKAAGDVALAHAGIDGVEQALTNGHGIGSHGVPHLQSVLLTS